MRVWTEYGLEYAFGLLWKFAVVLGVYGIGQGGNWFGLFFCAFAVSGTVLRHRTVSIGAVSV